MKRCHRAIWIVLGVLAWTDLPLADVEESSSAADLGKISYERYCAACHGMDGRGNGDLANLLTVAPADLTTIAERRGGSFPAEEIAGWIDGRRTPRAHGTAEMPVWGERLSESDRTAGGEAGVGGEIGLVVHYLRSIQRGVERKPEAPEAAAKTVAQVGEEQFARHCASCHGISGRGDGYVGKLLAKPPANLRTIAKRNGGKFPSRRIAAIIDGREDVMAHGPREMPVWGKRFRARGGLGRESTARGEIMLYVAYLRSIQEP